MPQQSPLRLIKRCRLYWKRAGSRKIPHKTRGIYVLYREKLARGKKKKYDVFYIGVGGVSKNATSGVGARIHEHEKKKESWTHFSFFEVHDNISREEILELEGFFLRIFRHDDRIKLDNMQRGSGVLKDLSKDSVW
jgi:hypothetical protein